MFFRSFLAQFTQVLTSTLLLAEKSRDVLVGHSGCDVRVHGEISLVIDVLVGLSVVIVVVVVVEGTGAGFVFLVVQEFVKFWLLDVPVGGRELI